MNAPELSNHVWEGSTVVWNINAPPTEREAQLHNASPNKIAHMGLTVPSIRLFHVLRTRSKGCRRSSVSKTMLMMMKDDREEERGNGRAAVSNPSPVGVWASTATS